MQNMTVFKCRKVTEQLEKNVISATDGVQIPVSKVKLRTELRKYARLDLTSAQAAILDYLVGALPEGFLGIGQRAIVSIPTKKIAQAFGKDPRWIRRIIDQLVQKGLICFYESSNGQRTDGNGINANARGIDLTPAANNLAYFVERRKQLYISKNAEKVAQDEIRKLKRQNKAIYEALPTNTKQGEIAWRTSEAINHDKSVSYHTRVKILVKLQAELNEILKSQTEVKSAKITPHITINQNNYKTSVCTAAEPQTEKPEVGKTGSELAFELQSDCDLQDAIKQRQNGAERGHSEAFSDQELNQPVQEQIRLQRRLNRFDPHFTDYTRSAQIEEHRRYGNECVRHIHPDMLKSAFPAVQMMLSVEFTGWDNLLNNTRELQVALGVSNDAFDECLTACESLGTALCLAITAEKILRNPDSIKSPGGYLRGMTAKSWKEKLNLSATVHGLIRTSYNWVNEEI